MRHRVLCDQGIDHGIGIKGWMHPPVHRLLGWISKPSSFKLSRHVWKLNQIRGINSENIFVKGNPAEVDLSLINKLPTLINSYLLDRTGERIGLIADFIFKPSTGQIINYLVSRSDPRIPGTSRWRLSIEQILEQDTGFISTNLKSLNDLPLVKTSMRQELINKSFKFRQQFQEISELASDRLEGWLEEPPWDKSDSLEELIHYPDNSENEDSPEYSGYNPLTNNKGRNKKLDYRSRRTEEEDPWV